MSGQVARRPAYFAATNRRPDRHTRGATDGCCSNTPNSGAGCSSSEAAHKDD